MFLGPELYNSIKFASYAFHHQITPRYNALLGFTFVMESKLFF